jgi:hypothetical protein
VIHCRDHLRFTVRIRCISANHIQRTEFKPYPEHVEYSSQVVQDLKERDTHDKEEGREVKRARRFFCTVVPTSLCLLIINGERERYRKNL